MALDVPSLIAAQMLTMVALAVAVPCLMGRAASVPAQRAQGAMLLQCLGWALAFWPEHVAITTVSIALLGASLAMLWEGVTLWLGRRRQLRRWVWGLTVAAPLGFALAQHSLALRTGWANGVMAVLLFLLCLELLQPASRESRRWRYTMVVSLLATGGATAWRGAEAALDPVGYGGFVSGHLSNVVASLITLQTFALVTMASLVAWRDEAELALQRLATTDALTGLMNRRAFAAELAPLLAHAGRHSRGALLLLDLDHFKAINDTHGHAAGDRALALAAQCMLAQMRRGDLACRWGGEEFCLYLVDGDERAVRELDARLRAALTLQSTASLGWPVAYSGGAALLDAGNAQLETLAHAADLALYQAKAAGRGRVVMAG